jgi:ketosteroid isomerase-like protein
MQKGTRWKARNIFTGRNVICIEWDAEVTLRDGRVVKLPEVAIHEIAGGKIARERYYYNPLAFTPSA